jgi:hypothetical protein
MALSRKKLTTFKEIRKDVCVKRVRIVGSWYGSDALAEVDINLLKPLMRAYEKREARMTMIRALHV